MFINSPYFWPVFVSVLSLISFFWLEGRIRRLRRRFKECPSSPAVDMPIAVQHNFRSVLFMAILFAAAYALTKVSAEVLGLAVVNPATAMHVLGTLALLSLLLSHGEEERVLREKNRTFVKSLGDKTMSEINQAEPSVSADADDGSRKFIGIYRGSFVDGGGSYLVFSDREGGECRLLLVAQEPERIIADLSGDVDKSFEVIARLSDGEYVVYEGDWTYVSGDSEEPAKRQRVKSTLPFTGIYEKNDLIDGVYRLQFFKFNRYRDILPLYSQNADQIVAWLEECKGRPLEVPYVVDNGNSYMTGEGLSLIDETSLLYKAMLRKFEEGEITVKGLPKASPQAA